MSERSRRSEEDTRPRGRAGTRTVTRIGAPLAAARTTMRAEAAGAGLATPRVIRKRLAGAGSALTTATAAGMATARVTRKPLAGAGRTDIYPNAATTRRDAVEAALARMRVNIAAALATTIGAARADAAGARSTTIIVDRRGAMAAGRATPRAIPRVRAGGGKTVAKTLQTLRFDQLLAEARSWPGHQWESHHAFTQS